ncbi:hypothetical protein MBH78_21140 [Oceanimonas sp. NS1]|nr:hypothetical protein [Oceanimonas sp. NS1]
MFKLPGFLQRGASERKRLAAAKEIRTTIEDIIRPATGRPKSAAPAARSHKPSWRTSRIFCLPAAGQRRQHRSAVRL